MRPRRVSSRWIGGSLRGRGVPSERGGSSEGDGIAPAAHPWRWRSRGRIRGRRARRRRRGGVGGSGSGFDGRRRLLGRDLVYRGGREGSDPICRAAAPGRRTDVAAAHWQAAVARQQQDAVERAARPPGTPVGEGLVVPGSPGCPMRRPTDRSRGLQANHHLSTFRHHQASQAEYCEASSISQNDLLDVAEPYHTPRIPLP